MRNPIGFNEELCKRMSRDLGQPCPYQAGDTVYYLSPATESAVRKSRVKEVRPYQRGRGYLRLTEYDLLLENGDTAKEHDAFATRREALVKVREELLRRLTWNRTALKNLMQEIARQEATLNIIEKNIRKED